MTDDNTDTDPRVWAKRLERQRDTMMTLDEYAAEIGVPVATLRKWRQRLSGGAVAVRVVVVPPPPLGEGPTARCANPQCAQLFTPNRTRRDHRYCSDRCRIRCATARWYRRARGGGEP